MGAIATLIFGTLPNHLPNQHSGLERELIRERTRDALAAKKRRGEHVGRRPAFNPSRLQAAREMLESGHGAARVLKVGRSTLYRALAVAS